jgi:hypothetical protein
MKSVYLQSFLLIAVHRGSCPSLKLLPSCSNSSEKTCGTQFKILGELEVDQADLRLHSLPHYIKFQQQNNKRISSTYQCILSIISRCDWFCRKSSIGSIRIHPTGVTIFEPRKSACHQQDDNEANSARCRYSLSHDHRFKSIVVSVLVVVVVRK